MAAAALAAAAAAASILLFKLLNAKQHFLIICSLLHLLGLPPLESRARLLVLLLGGPGPGGWTGRWTGLKGRKSRAGRGGSDWTRLRVARGGAGRRNGGGLWTSRGGRTGRGSGTGCTGLRVGLRGAGRGDRGRRIVVLQIFLYIFYNYDLLKNSLKLWRRRLGHDRGRGRPRRGHRRTGRRTGLGRLGPVGRGRRRSGHRRPERIDAGRCLCRRGRLCREEVGRRRAERASLFFKNIQLKHVIVC